MGKAYEKVYEVTYGETDGRKDCRITSMMNFFRLLLKSRRKEFNELCR